MTHCPIRGQYCDTLANQKPLLLPDDDPVVVIQREVCLHSEHHVLAHLDVSVVGPDVDVVILGAVAAVGGGLCLGPDRCLGVLVEGGQINLLGVFRHIKCEPGIKKIYRNMTSLLYQCQCFLSNLCTPLFLYSS